MTLIAGYATDSGPYLEPASSLEANLPLEPASVRQHSPVLAVVGASGGCGASSLAAVLAACRPGGAARATLIDLDSFGGGIDVLLGLDAQVGARWSDLRLGGGVLAPAAMRDRLPALAGVGVLACDGGADPSARDVEQVLAAARQVGPVVLDIPRWLPAAVLGVLPSVDAAIVLVPAEVRAVVAGADLLQRLARLEVRAIAVLRPGPVPIPDAARALGARAGDLLPLCRWLGGDSGCGLELGAVPGRVAALCRTLWSRVDDAA